MLAGFSSFDELCLQDGAIRGGVHTVSHFYLNLHEFCLTRYLVVFGSSFVCPLIGVYSFVRWCQLKQSVVSTARAW